MSLHAHTFYSKETLAFVPDCAAHLPVVARLFQAELRRYRVRRRGTVDFTRAYWRPPLLPAAVLQSERRQIVRDLDLAPLVSITDHDAIKAGLILRRAGDPSHPISLEWTAPFGAAFLHIGLHNLAPARAHAQMRALAEYTRAPRPARLG